MVSCFESHFCYLLDRKCYAIYLTSLRLQFPHLQNGDIHGINLITLLCELDKIKHIKQLRQYLVQNEDVINVCYY